jgi:FYVE/RhoGEF/PH domain-containing protein 5/6
MVDLGNAEKDPVFAEMLKTLRRDGAPGTMDIRSYLITPVQRLPRYELLMREVLSSTPPTHPDHVALVAVQGNIVSVNKAINERMRGDAYVKQIEQLRKRFVSDPGFLLTQVLIKEGDVLKKCSNGRVEKRKLLLFRDALAYAKVVNRGGVSMLTLSAKAPLRAVRITDLSDLSDRKFRFEMAIHNGKKFS